MLLDEEEESSLQTLQHNIKNAFWMDTYFPGRMRPIRQVYTMNAEDPCLVTKAWQGVCAVWENLSKAEGHLALYLRHNSPFPGILHLWLGVIFFQLSFNCIV